MGQNGEPSISKDIKHVPATSPDKGLKFMMLSRILFDIVKN